MVTVSTYTCLCRGEQGVGKAGEVGAQGQSGGRRHLGEPVTGTGGDVEGGDAEFGHAYL